MDKHLNRRDFLKVTTSAGIGLTLMHSPVTLASTLMPASSNTKVILAVAGIRSRGTALARKFASLKLVEVKYVIDVDNRYLDNAVGKVEEIQGKKPLAIKDYRKALDDKDVDAIAIATPDHWHAPMSIEALKAEKNVYVEKPCSHNPFEGEMLVEACRKYKKLVQMGNQRRSSKIVKEMIAQMKNGLIGRIYLAKCFYTNKRPPIGFGKKIDVPDYLDWDLWQGPAPRTPYRDNVHPYNWHWFWNWGTGEALNNGVHMLDLARWAMELDYPVKAVSSGGRWHHVGIDDWQCPDTQEILLEFEAGKMITWFGRSTNKFSQGYKGFGVLFFGTEGILDYNGLNTYHIYDLDNKLIKTVSKSSLSKKADQTNTKDPGLNDRHAENFIQAIRGLEKLNSPIDGGHKSTLLGHLGNISLRVGRTLQLNKQNGHILNDAEAVNLWKRAYEPGWKPKV